MIALCKMNCLREKLETGLLETTIVVKLSDFNDKMIGTPRHKKEKVLNGSM